MIQTTRLLALSLLFTAVFGFALSARPAHAALPFTVTVTPAKDTVAPGATAVFRIRVDGQTATLPSFNFDVEGGTLAGISSLDPTAANVAEGAVFVTRDTAGLATLSVRLGGEVLATSQALFAQAGVVSVSVQLEADAAAAARTWRYEVVSASGLVVASLTANTSGDAPLHTVVTPELPYGFYTVRQVLGNDTRPACAAGVFYEVAAPVGAETTIELASAASSVRFVIRPCPSLPRDLAVIIPIDTLAPPAGILGEPDVLPGEAPISEVRGVRQPGPGEPLPPATGNTSAVDPASSAQSVLALVLGALAALSGGAATVATARNRPRR